MFDQKTIGAIEYYVYALVDPRDHSVFYVGKGEGNRVFDHAAGEVPEKSTSLKLGKIAEIKRLDKEVQHWIVRYGLSEKEAFLVEAAIIDFVDLLPHSLTNVQSGHGANINGLILTDHLSARYQAKLLEAIGPEVMIVNINRRYNDLTVGTSIYELARGSWRMAHGRTESVKIVLAEYRGLVVEVFQVNSWHQDGERWTFQGDIASAEIRNLYNGGGISRPRGAANPVRYRL